MKTPRTNMWLALTVWLLLGTPDPASAADGDQDHAKPTVVVTADDEAVTQGGVPSAVPEGHVEDFAITAGRSIEGESVGRTLRRAWLAVGMRARAWAEASRAWSGSLPARLESWGVPPLAAFLGLAGLSLIVLGGRSMRAPKAPGETPEGVGRRVARKKSRLRPPRRPACRDAARLEAALRARNAA